MARAKTKGNGSYQPSSAPVDPSDLPNDMAPLLESLAEKVHDAWAAGRMREGWQWGPERSDAQKTNPTLVPYSDLPESEKAFDRQTAATTIRSILDLGYQIIPVSAQEEISLCATQEMELLQQNRTSPSTLLKIWEKHLPKIWRMNPRIYVFAAETMCRYGEAFTAYDICREGLAAFPDHPRLRQLEAWALAQGGALTTARERLTALAESNHEDSSETWCLLARTWKDSAFLEKDPSKCTAAMNKSLEAYRRGYDRSLSEKSPADYPAINCATLYLFLGDRSNMEKYARIAYNKALVRHPEDPWASATMAEACLLLGNLDEAKINYRAFQSNCAGETAVIASARKQAHRILSVKGENPSLVEDFLSLPCIHLHPQRKCQEPNTPRMAVVSLTSTGASEQIHQLLSVDCTLKIILPLAPKWMPVDLLADPELPGEWESRGADILIVHSGGYSIFPELLDYTKLIARGVAMEWADTLATSFIQPKDTPSEHNNPKSPLAFAFADVAGYSRLSEDAVIRYQKRFLPALYRYLNSFSPPPLTGETWGDAIFLGFKDLASAAQISLGLQDFFANYRWREEGFTTPLRMRVALHCGPAHIVRNPFLGKETITGTQVSRAARIEPVANEGQIFCSHTFQLSARALGLSNCSFSYAGRFPLPKNTGYEKVYRLLP